jgi:Cu(I)/Ag(I) efflux system periplasmic protein CusF
MKRVAVAMLFAALAVPAAAQMKGMDMKDMDMKMDKGGKKSAAKSHHATGTVKSVDAAKGTVTVDHEPVTSMNWPAMSMTFKTKDKKSLQAIKPGQKIEFDFVQRGKDYVITKVK